jgi:hypothetical protein
MSENVIRSAASCRERNARGSAADRRARRAWIVSPRAPFGGDDVKVPCVHCGIVVAAEEVDIDRIEPGGSYRRGNIQPSCRPCNLARSDNADWVGPTGR